MNDPREIGHAPRSSSRSTRLSRNAATEQQSDGDVDVAVYASARPGDLNISGYTHDYDWKNIPKLKNKTKYPRGTVIVDVLAPKSHELLWRGETVAPISPDSAKYEAYLRAAVERVVAKYPESKHKS